MNNGTVILRKGSVSFPMITAGRMYSYIFPQLLEKALKA